MQNASQGNASRVSTSRSRGSLCTLHFRLCFAGLCGEASRFEHRPTRPASCRDPLRNTTTRREPRLLGHRGELARSPRPPRRSERAHTVCSSIGSRVVCLRPLPLKLSAGTINSSPASSRPAPSPRAGSSATSSSSARAIRRLGVAVAATSRHLSLQWNAVRFEHVEDGMVSGMVARLRAAVAALVGMGRPWLHDRLTLRGGVNLRRIER